MVEAVPGLSTMVFGVLVDLGQNLGILGLYISSIIHGKHKFQMWVIKREPTYAIVTFLCGVYLVISFIGTLFLFYALAKRSDLKKCKKICIRWVMFRMLCFLIPIAFLIGVGGNATITICAVVILLWFISILLVATYYFNISETLDPRPPIKVEANKPRRVRRRHSIRPISKVKPANQNRSHSTGELTEEHLRQLEQFQAYIRRTSWCSWSDELGPPSRSGSSIHSVQSRVQV